jgi:hypothetical protein
LAAKSPDDEELLQVCRDRFKLAAQSEASSRREMLDDLEFSIGKQWPQSISAQRQLDNRPCLTMNRLPQFIRQVTNEQRQQRPSIEINPIGDGADVDTSEIFEGIIRHIETNSHASVAYDTGFDFMVRIGCGCWRVVTDWIAEETEDQEIYIVPIDNPFTVYLDPTNKRDPGWGFIIEDLLAEEFKRQFPDSRYGSGNASLQDYESIGDMPANWANTINGQPSIRIAEYFEVVKGKGDKGRQKRKVKWAKISGLDVLDERDWPGKYIPIVKIYGDDIIVNGERHIAGLVRDAKDPQRAYNYWISAATERIALAPKAPWQVAEGQIEGYEKMYEQANVRNMAFLPYKQVDAGGKPAPPPIRNIADVGVQGMEQMLQLAVQDMQATTGLYPNNLGEKQSSNESGKAVLARQKQGDINTLNYSDNHARGIEHTGTIILDLIPKVYTSARIQRIIKPDGTASMVGIYNSRSDETEKDVPEDESIKKVYDIGTGRFDVAVSVGPSYQSKRQESVASQMALVQAFPQVFTIIGDQIVRNMDWPGAKEIADRLKKMLPPQLQDNDGTPEAQLAQAHSQLQQLTQQHQVAMQQLQEATQIIETKKVEQQGKVQIAAAQEQAKVSIVRMQEATKLAVAQMNASKDQNQTFAEAEIQKYQIMHDAAHDVAMQGQQQEHEQQMAAAGVQQDQISQASDQTHDMAMAAQQSENGASDAGN